MQFASLSDLFEGISKPNQVTLLQPFVLCKTKQAIGIVGQQAELRDVMVPCWMQFFIESPTRNRLCSAMLWGKPIAGQQLKGYNDALHVLTVGNLSFYTPNMIGLKTGLDENWIHGEGGELTCYWQRIGNGVRIGLQADNPEVAKAFVDSEAKEIKDADKLPWEN